MTEPVRVYHSLDEYRKAHGIPTPCPRCKGRGYVWADSIEGAPYGTHKSEVALCPDCLKLGEAFGKESPTVTIGGKVYPTTADGAYIIGKPLASEKE